MSLLLQFKLRTKLSRSKIGTSFTATNNSKTYYGLVSAPGLVDIYRVTLSGQDVKDRLLHKEVSISTIHSMTLTSVEVIILKKRKVSLHTEHVS